MLSKCTFPQFTTKWEGSPGVPEVVKTSDYFYVFYVNIGSIFKDYWALEFNFAEEFLSFKK